MRDILIIFLWAALITLGSSRSVDKELLELTKNLNSQFNFDNTRDQEFFNAFGIDQSFEDYYYDGSQYEDSKHLYEDNGKRQYQGEYDEVERAAGAFESIKIPHKEQSFLHNTEAKVKKSENIIEDGNDDEWDYSNSDEEDEKTNEENGTDIEKPKNVKYDIKGRETINNNHDYSEFNNNRQGLVNKGNKYQEEMSENVQTQNELNSQEDISYEDIDDLENNSDDDSDDEEDEDDNDEYQDEEYDSDYDYQGDSDEQEDEYDSEEEESDDYVDEEEEDEENSKDDTDNYYDD